MQEIYEIKLKNKKQKQRIQNLPAFHLANEKVQNDCPIEMEQSHKLILAIATTLYLVYKFLNIYNCK